MKTDNEKILKKAAALYVKQMGEALIQENAEAIPELESDNKYWRRISSRIRLNKSVKAVFIAAPVAACLLAVVVILRTPPAETGGIASLPSVSLSNEQASAASAPQDSAALSPATASASAPARTEIAFLSAKLPEGYTLTHTDYDYNKTIYYVANSRHNDIILVAEPSTAFTPAIDGNFIYTQINGTDAYMMARKDYNILLLHTEGLLYIFTSPFDPQDLIEVATAII
jgi:hypothetical protein